MSLIIIIIIFYLFSALSLHVLPDEELQKIIKNRPGMTINELRAKKWGDLATAGVMIVLVHLVQL